MNRPTRSTQRDSHLLERRPGQVEQLGAVSSMRSVQGNSIIRKNRLPARHERHQVVRAVSPKPAEKFVFQVNEQGLIGGAGRFEIEPGLAFLPLSVFGQQRLVGRSKLALARLGFNQGPEHAPHVVCENGAIGKVFGPWVAAVRPRLESREYGQQSILDQVATGGAPQAALCQVAVGEFSELPLYLVVHLDDEFKTAVLRCLHNAILFRVLWAW